MPRLLLTTGCIAVAACVFASLATAAPPRRGLARALAVPHIAPKRTGALAVDLKTGKTLFAVHPTLPLAPASNEKLAITLAALRELGPLFTIDTDVLATGAQVDTTLKGDIFLLGRGDPTLTTDGLAALAQRVAESGITRVTGRVIADESYFDALRTGPGWKPSFYIYECPPLSALAVNRGWTGTHTSHDPALAAASVFRRELAKAGVTVARGVTKGIAPEDARFLATWDSAPLEEILRFMDHVSDNYTAELLLKQLGTIDHVQGSSASGSVVVRRSLAEGGVPTGGLVIADGSGLSLRDRLTASALAGILRSAWNDFALRAPFFDALAVAGVNGTLAGRMRSRLTKGKVVAKTGTTDGASALSGYVRRRYAFAIVQNGSPVSTYWARRAQDRFATVLASG